MPLASPRARLTIATASSACVLLAGCGPGGSGAGAPVSGAPASGAPASGASGSAAVRLAPPTPPPAVARRCAALARGLPQRLDGQPRRAVKPSSPLTAAWGNPPIVLRCGVPLPAALTPTAELTVVNGVAWFPEPAGAATPARFTEVGREAYVELTVPARYAPAGPILVVVSNAIAPAVPAKPGGQI
jgi:Protein of unknown function (DUF3515)